MKRLIISKNVKLLLIAITVMLMGATSFLIYNEVKNRGFKEEKEILYTYKNNSSVNYRVTFKPDNIVYNNQSIGEGEAYLTALVDYIKATFAYEFQGERPADIKGDYEAVAVVEGYVGEGKTYKTIWQKKFTLIPKTNFQSKEKSISIKKDVTLKLDSYNNFVNTVIETTKASSNVKLSVFMNVNLKVNTESGTIEETITPSIALPLNTGYFEVVKKQTEEKPGAIEKIKKVQLPVDKKMIAIFSGILGILVIALLYLIFFTTVLKDPFVLQLNTIFKKYGNRLVALNNDPVSTYEKQSNVRSIDDLVRIADEIGKPIMYRYSPNSEEINTFYVFDVEHLYIFELPASKTWAVVSTKIEATQTKTI